MNRMTLRTYHEVKNQAFTVVAFRNNVRVMTCSNYSIIKATDEILTNTKRGFVSLLFKEGELPSSSDHGSSRNFDDYI